MLLSMPRMEGEEYEMTASIPLWRTIGMVLVPVLVVVFIVVLATAEQMAEWDKERRKGKIEI